MYVGTGPNIIILVCCLSPYNGAIDLKNIGHFEIKNGSATCNWMIPEKSKVKITLVCVDLEAPL